MITVLIGGYFWHGCKEYRNIPAHNSGWWQNKIDQNRLQDRNTDEKLREAGWTVFRFCEHDVVEMIVERVMGAITAKTKRPK